MDEIILSILDGKVECSYKCLECDFLEGKCHRYDDWKSGGSSGNFEIYSRKI